MHWSVNLSCQSLSTNATYTLSKWASLVGGGTHLDLGEIPGSESHQGDLGGGSLFVVRGSEVDLPLKKPLVPFDKKN